MSQLKRLAGDTAIYGISSILGRSINFLLVFLHTSIFAREQLGIVTVLYSYVAILNVIYTFGMETAFFRYVTKSDKSHAYNAACTTVLFISTLVSSLIIACATPIAEWIGFPDSETLIIWLAIILWIDGIMAIPFARLRQENKARLFAGVKVGNILINVSLQLFFLLFLPKLHLPVFQSIYDSELGIGYIILANLIANALLIPFLWRYLFRIRIFIDRAYLKPMLIYATPILFMGVAGMINEMMGNILLEKLLPDTFYATMDSTAAVGVYGQTLKLSIFMMLAIQAFRYAGEPFFFNNANDKNAPVLFARVMHYFIIVCLLLLILVTVNIQLIAEIFLRRPEYRVALYLVPILLSGKLFYGIYVNLNVWFKLTDKTIYGTYFSILGALVTIVGNLLLIPVLGFLGSAIVSVLCYFSMAIACYIIGKKHYPIPYNFRKLIPYFIVTLVMVFLSMYYHYTNFMIDSIIRVVLSVIVVAIVIIIEKPRTVKNTTHFS